MPTLQDEAAVKVAEARLAGRNDDSTAVAYADGDEATSGSESDSDSSGNDANDELRGGADHASLPKGSTSQLPSAQADSKGAQLRHDAEAKPSIRRKRTSGRTEKRRKIQEL